MWQTGSLADNPSKNKLKQTDITEKAEIKFWIRTPK